MRPPPNKYVSCVLSSHPLIGCSQPKDIIRGLKPSEDTEVLLHRSHARGYEVYVCENASPLSFSRRISK